ncbi:hypothetical protein JCGZ_01890 [Jatropha curcas]|uniref:Rieske domain-containing protein n=1 Tax=Jatropha curcas TaxID=180498 RepID=A0A067L0Z9_JATCU|nr:hypothetical protein JCGZ_01890 [Jatropha curcas]
METIIKSSFPSFHMSATLTQANFAKPKFLNFQFKTSSFSRIHNTPSKSKLFTTVSSQSSVSTDQSIEPPKPELETDSQGDKFDWYAHWCPIMPVCDLDKRVPHAKKEMGIDVVVWGDRNESAWKVFDDSCPHRLAPLSEGRIDQWGRLQCVYHGWCFNGSGDCKFIPQADPNGPPVHTFKKACAGVYPSTVQNDIVWFWPNADPQLKDIITKQKPPFIPELDDPSFSKTIGAVRDLPYGYDVLIENLMDPAHLNYAHYGIIPVRENEEKADREGGRPLDMGVQKVDINGFIGKTNGFPGQNDWANCKFIAPYIFYFYTDPMEQPKEVLIFICVPVSPGKSRSISAFPRNSSSAVWIDKIIPRWINHMAQNLLFDSDLYLLHYEERKIRDIGVTNWQKACFVPTKSDALAVSFRRWLNKYAGGQVDWRGKYSGALPPTPPREQLMDRYWSHVVNCSSCKAAYKGLNALEIILQVTSLISICIAAVAKESTMSMTARTTLVAITVVCFASARWLANFIYKNFHFHDYNHAFR